VKFTGQHTLHAPVERVWDALLDPAVLVRTIPGCERLEETGTHAYAMTVTAGVAAIKGTYTGSCTLTDLVPHESLVMRLDGAGAPGTIGATVPVTFTAVDGGTSVTYDADAVVGGMLGGVGQRMLTSVSKRMAGEFFGNVAQAIETPPTDVVVKEVVEQEGHPPADRTGTAAGVFTPPGRQPASQADFLRGVAVGAGLVALGVVLGGVFGRRS
jgi:carbon monoxide dehydrogenase subunit G